MSYIDLTIKNKEKEIEQTRKDFTPLMNKIKLQDELKIKNEQIKKEQDKLNDISIKKKNLDIKKTVL